MKKGVLGISLLVVVLLLAITTPNEEDFRSWRKSESIGNSDNAAQLLVNRAIGVQEDFTGQYRSYVVFATMETRVLRSDARYLGILGQWIPMN